MWCGQVRDDILIYMGLLDDRVAWVTGAGRGFGAGIAHGLVLAGAKVCLTDIDIGELSTTVDEIGAKSDQTFVQLADVSDSNEMKLAADAIVDKWGRLDVVICNAATMPLVPFADHTPEFWRKMIDVNLSGVYHAVWAAWPHLMRQGGGHCVAIASGASVGGFVNEIAYCTAKHGIEGFAKALAMEAEPVNIAVNTMGPGGVIKPTEITRAQAKQMTQLERSRWLDPLSLSPAFVWLVTQPPARFSGLRFDAGRLAATISAEGYKFLFTPEKATSYVDDMKLRIDQRRLWTMLAVD